MGGAALTSDQTHLALFARFRPLQTGLIRYDSSKWNHLRKFDDKKGMFGDHSQIFLLKIFYIFFLFSELDIVRIIKYFKNESFSINF